MTFKLRTEDVPIGVLRYYEAQVYEALDKLLLKTLEANDFMLIDHELVAAYGDLFDLIWLNIWLQFREATELGSN